MSLLLPPSNLCSVCRRGFSFGVRNFGIKGDNVRNGHFFEAPVLKVMHGSKDVPVDERSSPHTPEI